MRLEDIHTIVVHTSATPRSMDIGAKEIDAMHRAPPNNWDRIGYHAVGRIDGRIEPGRLMTEQGIHVRGNNENTLGYCLIGGLEDVTREPTNTYTPPQYDSLESWLKRAVLLCPNVHTICGHRDFSPDLDGDGIIKEFEWVKVCPCFDVKEWLESRGHEDVSALRAAAEWDAANQKKNSKAMQPPPKSPHTAPTGPKVGVTYIVRPGDTLYGIVRRLPSVHRDRVATVARIVFKNNPQAFIEGDMNKLRAGATLSLSGIDDH